MVRGSVMELETHLHIAVRLGYLKAGDTASAREHADAVARMVTRLKRRLARPP
jgi:four helix bundle protein